MESPAGVTLLEMARRATQIATQNHSGRTNLEAKRLRQNQSGKTTLQCLKQTKKVFLALGTNQLKFKLKKFK